MVCVFCVCVCFRFVKVCVLGAFFYFDCFVFCACCFARLRFCLLFVWSFCVCFRACVVFCVFGVICSNMCVVLLVVLLLCCCLLFGCGPPLVRLRACVVIRLRVLVCLLRCCV